MSAIYGFASLLDTLFDYPQGSFFPTRIRTTEEDNSILVDIDLPGVNKKDLSLSFSEKTLFIKGKRDGNEFLYKVPIYTNNIDISSATSKLEDGILKITLPVVKDRAKSIKIE